MYSVRLPEQPGTVVTCRLVSNRGGTRSDVGRLTPTGYTDKFLCEFPQYLSRIRG
jgi:hypothetical protein